jgi:hypothetical protein
MTGSRDQLDPELILEGTWHHKPRVLDGASDSSKEDSPAPPWKKKKNLKIKKLTASMVATGTVWPQNPLPKASSAQDPVTMMDFLHVFDTEHEEEKSYEH